MEPNERFIPAADFAKHRVIRSNGEITVDGLYPEKAPGRFMVRVRLVGGRIDLAAFRGLADLADRFADGEFHCDTRENIELHGVTAPNVVPLVEAIEAIGLTTRGSCGDTVRSIVVGGEAGSFAQGALDLHALAQALSRRFTGKPEFETLPRKFKIGLFSADDREPLHRVQDIGFLEDRQSRTLSAFIGGGLGREPHLGVPFASGLAPEAEILLPFVEAVVRVFHERGERKNRAKARFKWVLLEHGTDAVTGWILEKWRPPEGVTIRPESGSEIAHARLSDDGLHAQADGRIRVAIPLIAGDIDTKLARALAQAIEAHGGGGLLLGTRQNLSAPDIAPERVASLREALTALGFAPEGLGGPRDLVACPGAAQCRKAFVETREFAHELAAALEGVRAPQWAKRIRVGLSGCPNACTIPHLQDIGLRGQIGVLAGQKRQGFDLLLGGRVNGGTELGREVARFLDQDETVLVLREAVRIFAEYGDKHADFGPWLAGFGVERFARVLALRVPLAYGAWGEGIAPPAAPRTRAEVEAASRHLEALPPREILRWAEDVYGADLLVTSALGAGGVLLGAWLREIAPARRVHFIDTGKLFKETLAYRDELVVRHWLNIETVGPDCAEPEFASRYGEGLWSRDADLCCTLRKVVPLARLRKGKRAWVSALRREQGGTRASAPLLSLESDGVVKIAPLLHATRAEIDARLAQLGIPQHPLYARGYTSLGCEPCTKPSRTGERDGRWAESGKTECGLHTFWQSRGQAQGKAPAPATTEINHA
jgi:sulfite reductase (ferredoxin)